MKTFVCTKNSVFDFSELLSLNCDDNGIILCASKLRKGVGRILPYDEDELRQFIWDGKLDAGNLGAFISDFSPHAETDPSKGNTDFCTFLFLVRDAKGNIKLCDKDFLAPAKDAAARLNAGYAAFVFINPFFRTGYTFDDAN